MFGKTKQRELQEQIRQYCNKIATCLEVFKRALARACEAPEYGDLLKNWTEVHAAESNADDLRRSIEVRMYSKMLFPESRGDIMGLLETMDRVPNQAEAAIKMIRDTHMEIPTQFGPDMMALAEVCRRCGEAMIDAAMMIFDDYTAATVSVGKIDELESEADVIEGRLLQKVFSSDLPDLQKMLLRDLIEKVAGVSDKAENVGDRIRIIVCKRSI